jgi:cytochrome c-type biogenesis protein
MTPLSLAPAAFLAGVLMFLAPCTLPIVPGYMAFIAGVSPEEERNLSANARRRVMLNALAFVIGFTAVFVLFGVFAAFLGSLLGTWRYTLARAAGAILILFGVTMLGFTRVPGLSGEWHARLPKWLTLGHPQSSLLVGVFFALGWSPCIGPVLGSVLFLASASATALQGAALLLVFSAGLAMPFLLVAAALALQFAGGIMLIALGVLMLLGLMGELSTWGYDLFSFLGYDRLLNYL